MSEQAQWLENNDRYLAALIAWLRLRLKRLSAPPPAEPVVEEPQSSCSWFGWCKAPAKKQLPPPSRVPTEEDIETARQEMIKREKHEPPPALILLADSLGLSTFDRYVLALCAAMELDTRIAGLCAKAQADPNKPYPTFALAFVLFDDPDWNSLSPHGPLRHWRLLEINQPGTLPLTNASLGIDERIVNYLKGLNYLDDRLTSLLDPLRVQPFDEPLPRSQQQNVDSIVKRFTRANGLERAPVVELLGHDSASKRLVAEHIATELGLNLYTIDVNRLPVQSGDFETFNRLWQRESRLLPLALYIETDEIPETQKTLLRLFLRRNSGVVFLDLENTGIKLIRDRFSIEINKPTPKEQKQLWKEILQDQAGDLPQRLAEQFSFNQSEIKHLARSAMNPSSNGSQVTPSTTGGLWQACRVASRVEMERLAQRIDTKAHWDQLVLPSEQTTLLHQITDQVARRNRVYEDWGFRKRMNRGLGISALFTGESGTGKTMAAEVIANALELDLYRIDLSGVVSKYIGETEKNLRKLFDAAEDSGAILLFDEADALFGKRSEVKDSHDRYANIEINYLLQRMETYRGLAILASNMKSALDKAFVRRLRFIVDFPVPGTRERKEIWQKIFPAGTPVDEGLDYDRLAKFNLTGGNILNIALNAAFLAAEQDTPVTMPLVLDAARAEFKKLERPVKESDFKWQAHIEVVK